MTISRTELAASLLPAVIRNMQAPHNVSNGTIDLGVAASLRWAEAFLAKAKELDDAERHEATDSYLKNL